MNVKKILILAMPITLSAQEVNLVEHGEKKFQLWGCAECHVTKKDDNSLKTGPSLYNLFQTQAREIIVKNQNNQTITRKADQNYFKESVRNPQQNLAIVEHGTNKGNAYPPIMPKYLPDIVTDADLDAIWHYLRHSADEGKNGPATVSGKISEQSNNNDYWKKSTELLVTNRPRSIRAPIIDASGRAIHVGLPGGMNYTFDPRFLSLRSVWTGGFLNLNNEQQGRSTPGSLRGHNAKVLLEKNPRLIPLRADGKAIDFEFKEPDVNDEAACEKHLWKGGDFLKELADSDAAFLGYAVHPTNPPEFRFRIGSNYLNQQISFDSQARLVIRINGKISTPQKFQLDATNIKKIEVTGGTLENNIWTIQSGELNATLLLTITDAPVAQAPSPIQENLTAQELTTSPATTDLPPGYSIENWNAPTDTFGRAQLFEPTAIAVAKNGTIVVGTRTAGIWRIKNKKWSLFAEGTYECLGLMIEDDAGDKIVIAQKPEITRITDSNKDGFADTFDTVCDDFGFHANYHEYTHGLVRDKEGNYYFTLNLSHSKNERASYRAGGPFMGSMGGFRGWACRITPDGKFEPYAKGLRSPAGIGMTPDGRIIFIDNQGEYTGSSKITFLEKDHFYGHPSGLVSLPGLKPDSPEIDFKNWENQIHPCSHWFPHGKLANSPGHPAWDLTNGKFGAYSGQFFVGDQTISTLLRVSNEKIGDADQGTIFPFAFNLASGVMRPCFLPDSSLLLGQTGRGWQSKGGSQASLQRLIYDGKTICSDIHHITTEKDGFTLHLTNPLKAEVTNETLLPHLKITSWTYIDSVRYGSDQHDKKDHTFADVKISADKKSIHLSLTNFKDINCLYHIRLEKAANHFLQAPARESLEAYHTVRKIP